MCSITPKTNKTDLILKFKLKVIIKRKITLNRKKNLLIKALSECIFPKKNNNNNNDDVSHGHKAMTFTHE